MKTWSWGESSRADNSGKNDWLDNTVVVVQRGKLGCEVGEHQSEDNKSGGGGRIVNIEHCEHRDE